MRYHAAATLNLDECHEWMDRVRQLEIPQAIDTSANSAEDTTEQLLRLLGQ